MSYKLFLSHSSKDEKVVNAFVSFMYKIGLTEKDIVCSSVPETKIAIGNDIYAYLNQLISDENIYAIYFLSDNYYASPVCLNEMGAVWLRKADSLSILLPGFDFNDIQGVVERNKVGIKLGTCDNMTKAAFNEFLKILNDKFGIHPNQTHWENARDEFLNLTLENNRKFNMAFARSYCIDDLENDGCKIIKKESNQEKITAIINFEKTESKLCSIVVFAEKRNFTNYIANDRNLCFEAYISEGITFLDIEICLNGIDVSYEIYLNEDLREFKIPLAQFQGTFMFWKDVSELKFVFHRKNFSGERKVIIENLRIE